MTKPTVPDEAAADTAVSDDLMAGVSAILSAPQSKITPAESFAAWWDGTIPNSAVSRNTSAYNKAHALRSQMLAVLSSVTGE